MKYTADLPQPVRCTTRARRRCTTSASMAVHWSSRRCAAEPASRSRIAWARTRVAIGGLVAVIRPSCPAPLTQLVRVGVRGLVDARPPVTPSIVGTKFVAMTDDPGTIRALHLKPGVLWIAGRSSTAGPAKWTRASCASAAQQMMTTRPRSVLSGYLRVKPVTVIIRSPRLLVESAAARMRTRASAPSVHGPRAAAETRGA